MKCVIIGAVPITDGEFMKKYIQAGDFIIACDGGLDNAERLGVTPSLIIGDFDSHKRPETDIETIVLPCEKDDTDTVYAIKEALRRGYRDFILLGVTGARLDHTLGNVYALYMLKNAGADATIADEACEMLLVDSTPVYVTNEFDYFSLLNIIGNARGITIEGAKYNLKDAEITPDYQYGVSNEVAGDRAKITVTDGSLLLIKVRAERNGCYTEKS